MFEMLSDPAFWIAVGQIIMIDILLGGDNAVVIALACRKLPPAQRTKGIIWGTAGAIALRVVLIFFALTLLAIPFLKLVGAALLVWIGVKLLAPDEDGHGDVAASDKLFAQGAGEHQMPLVIFGLLVSIPIIVWGSQLVIKLMDRFPAIITAGGMLLGWIAGTMAVTDPAIVGHMPLASALVEGKLPDVLPAVRYGAGVAGALLVLAIGLAMKKRLAAKAVALSLIHI